MKKSVKTTTVTSTPTTSPPVIKVRDLSWPLRTLIVIAALGSLLITIYFIIAIYLILTANALA